MRIGINCIQIKPDYRGGVNTYTLGLLQGLARLDHPHQLQIFVTPENAHLFNKLKINSKVEVVILPFGGILGKLIILIVMCSLLSHSKNIHRWITNLFLGRFAAIMDKSSDVIYTPTTTLLPYSFRKPTILSMHDIQQVHYPQFFNWAQKLSRRIRFSLSTELATYIQASSNFMKKDFIENFNCLKQNNVVVIPEGVDIVKFRQVCSENIFEKYNLPERYLFYPAQLWPHKNHITVLKALNLLAKERGLVITLVLTGAEYSAKNQIVKYIQDEKIEWVRYLGKVDFDDLVSLYQNAHFFITAVLYESSSLPFLEAAAAGCPILASDTPPNRELAAILKATLFKPMDYHELANIIQKQWHNDKLIQEHVRHNQVAISHYGWENIASRYIDFMEAEIKS